jgi:hypothetical protein
MKNYIKTLFYWTFAVLAPALVFVGVFIGIAKSVNPEWDLRGEDIVELVINVQLQRAHRMSTPDLVILGDSSSLTGINAKTLNSELAPLHVESLATFRGHSPRGHGAMVEDLIAQHKSPKFILYQVHPGAAQGDPKTIEHLDRFTPQLKIQMAKGAFAEDPRDKLLDIFAFVLREPLPGIYGARYGKPIQYAKYLNSDNGTIVDPYPFGYETKECGTREPKFEVTEDYKERLRALAGVFASSGAKVGIMISAVPCILETAEYRSFRENFKNLLVETFKDATFLETPVSYPNDLFATDTHVNDRGRARFTQDISPVIKDWVSR